jgi:flagellar basal-body rod protein FlgF
MDNPGYVGLTRMNGLAKEMQAVANNIANISTTGYRAESVVFAEVLYEGQLDGGSLSMAQPRAHFTDPSPGGFTATGGPLDLAIEGGGYFQVMTPNGARLTRAGAFTMTAEGEVVNMQGHALLDGGGAPLAIPPGVGPVTISEDGTVSIEGDPIAEIGLYTANPDEMVREDGVLFRVDGPVQPAAEGGVLQGFLEESNVDPVAEMARMIEVQRAYELGMSFLDMEDSRIREAVRTIGRSS